MLAAEPGQSATVLVALATMGGMPRAMSEGKVRSVPPPAIAFTPPPSAETMTTSARVDVGERWSAAGMGGGASGITRTASIVSVGVSAERVSGFVAMEKQ